MQTARRGVAPYEDPVAAAPAATEHIEHARRFPVSGTFYGGLLNGNGSGADGAILILLISRTKKRDDL